MTDNNWRIIKQTGAKDIHRKIGQARIACHDRGKALLLDGFVEILMPHHPYQQGH